MGKAEKLKKSPSAYILFGADKRKEVQKALGTNSVSEVSKKIGEMWKALMLFGAFTGG